MILLVYKKYRSNTYGGERTKYGEEKETYWSRICFIWIVTSVLEVNCNLLKGIFYSLEHSLGK